MTEAQFVKHISLDRIPFRERLREAMLELMTVQFPIFRPELHVESANDAVVQMQKDIVRTYVQSDHH